MSKFLLILAFALLVISGLVSVKFKRDNRKKWWLPLTIGGGIAIIIITFIIWAVIVFLNTPLCV